MVGKQIKDISYCECFGSQSLFELIMSFQMNKVGHKFWPKLLETNNCLILITNLRSFFSITNEWNSTEV